jgi:hypothetical protein
VNEKLRANLTKIEELELERDILLEKANEFERRMSKNLDLLSPASFSTTYRSWNSMPEKDGLMTPVFIPGLGINHSLKDLNRFDQKVQNNLKDLQKLQDEIISLKEQNQQLLRDNKNNQRKFTQLEEELELNAREKKIIKDQNDQREKRFKDLLDEAETKMANASNDYKKEIASLKSLLQERQQANDLSKSSLRSIQIQSSGPSAREVQLSKKVEQLEVC